MVCHPSPSSRLSLAVILPVAALWLMLVALNPAWLHPANAAGTVHYVAPGGACSGPTPCYSTLQSAVDEAQAGDEIRVAQGTYTDVHAIGSLTQTVYLSKSLILRGGYALTDWTASWPLARPTVLDARGLGRVIYIASGVTVTVEGFSMTNGAADTGAGLYIAGGPATIQNNWIYGNSAYGSLGYEGGGGIYSNFSVTVRSNVIFSNTATTRGGGLYLMGGSALVEDNTIYANAAPGGQERGGGGIYVENSFATIRRNAIYSNTTQDSFSGNGGGIHIYGWAAGVAMVEQNDIHDNSAGNRGGGLYVRDGTHAIRNNLVHNNTAVGLGGGLHIRNNAGTVLENNTIYANTGDGLYLNQGSPNVRNNIVAGNSGFGVNADASFSVTYSVVWGNTSGAFGGSAVSGTGTIAQDPLLTFDLHVPLGSPAIDAADPNGFPTNDYAGFARPFGLHADMGAYEYHTGDCFARLNGGQVYTTVQAAVNAARLVTDVVKVAGICTDVGTVLDGGQTLTQTVYLSKPLTLQGGYAEMNWTAPIALTILDAQGAGRVIYVTGTSAITVDGFVIRNGNAAQAGNGTFGGGLYIASALNPTIQNVIFYNDTAEYGGGLSLVGGSARLFNNTFVSNTATISTGFGGGGLYIAGGSPIVSNTIVAGNVNGGIRAAAGTANLAYNDVWNNSGGDYVGGVTAGPHSLSVAPSFVNLAAADYHLTVDSPLMHAGDPGTTVQTDVEGDRRPLGSGYDIGADEAALYPNVTLTDSPVNSVNGIFRQRIVYTHTLVNNGTLMSDTFTLSHLLTVTGSGPNWGVDYTSQPITLMRNESRQVLVTVTVGGGISGTAAILDLTATSQANLYVHDTKTDVTLLNLTQGLELIPVTYTQQINPGAIVTFAHALVNTGNYTDNVTFVWNTSSPLPELRVVVTPAMSVAVGPFTQTTVWVSMSAKDTLPGGLTQTLVLTAQSSLSLTLRVMLTDSIGVNYTPGPRYVAGILPSAYDTLNNCHVKTLPCRTIIYAVGQAVNGDSVLVSRGTYHEGAEINLNKDVNLIGGFDFDFEPRKWNPAIYVTTLDGQNQRRVLNIFGNPTVQGFTIQNGKTSGAGGGVFINLGSPVLRQNIIISNTAGTYGGGIYNSNLLGAAETPRFERNLLAYNTAQRGGGFSSDVNTPSFWNNLVYANKAASGGGVYVGGGTPLIWHDTIFGNTDVITGGGVYLAAGTAWISNTIVAGNSASVGGGVYRQAGNPQLAYNDVWNNANGDYVGLSAGSNSKNIDPLFVNAASYNLRLQASSPLIGQGDWGPVREDYWGNPRPLESPEIGADEWMLVRPILTPDYIVYEYPGRTLTFTHVLTNAGNYTDTFTLFPQSGLGWSLTITPPVTVTLGVSQSALVTLTVAIPLTQTAFTADATVVTATSGNENAIWTTATDTVYVLRTAAITIEPPIEQALGYQGRLAVYTHVITNGGNYPDTFDLTYANSCVPSCSAWAVNLPANITLGAFSTTTLVITVNVPSSLPLSPVYVDTTFITATSRFSPTVFDTAVDTTYVNRTLGVQFTPNRSGSRPPGLTVPYTHTITNTGNYMDSFLLTASSSNDWPRHGGAITFSSNPVTLTAQGVATVYAYVIIPPNEISGTVDTMIVTATSLFSQTNPIYARVVDTTTVGPKAGVSLSGIFPAGALGWCFDPETGEGAQWWYWPYGFQLNNTGNLWDTFDVRLDNSEPIRLPASFDEYNFTPPVTRTLVGPIAPSNGTEIYVWMGIPPNSATFEAPLTVIATSLADGTRTALASYTSRVNWDNRLAWDTPALRQTLPGRTIVYTRELSHVGTQATTFGVEVSSAHGWPVVITTTDTSGMNPGDKRIIQVEVRIPGDTKVPTDTVSLLASTTESCLRQVSTRDIVSLDNVTLEPDYSAPLPPGTVYTYAHTLLNSGVTPDSYAITATDQLGWSFSYSPTYVMNLAPGAMVSVTAVITVPSTGPQSISGTVNVLVLTASSQQHQFDTPPLRDTATDTTTVAYALGALLTPNGSSHATLGGSLYYWHTLTNTGNYTQTFDLTTRPGDFGYADLITPTGPLTLSPGQVIAGIQVQVIIKDTAPINTVEDTSVFATFAGTQVVAHDLTTIDPRPGPRYVAANGTDINNNCQSPDTSGPCATVGQAVYQAAPGDPIYVAQGIYTGSLVLNKSLTLEGGHTVANWSAPPDPWLQTCVLDAQGLGRVISIPNGVSATVSGLKIMGGKTSGDGGGVYVNTTLPVTLSTNTLYSNTAANGGAVFVRSGGALRLYNNFVYSNTAGENGGGVYVAGGTANVFDDTFVANSATHSGVSNGAGLYVAGGTVTVQNSIFANNVNAGGGGWVAFGGTGDTNDFWSNTPSSALPGWSNILNVDPQFKDVVSGDLHLTPGSALVNSASSGQGTDIDYDVRPQLIPNVRTATPYDIGADEYAWVRAAAFEPPLGRKVNKSAQVIYTHLLTNTGSYTDTINLAAAFDRSDATVQVSSLPAQMAAGQSATVWVTITWTTPPPINTVGTAHITATSMLNPNAVVGTAKDVITYQDQADVQIDKSVTPTGVLGPGSLVTYRLAYSNPGPADASGVVITDTVPTMLTNVNVTSSPALSPRVGTHYVWDVGTLMSGASGVITLTSNISLPAGTDTTLVNTAMLATTAADPTPGNNSDTVTNTVHIPSVSIVKQVTPSNPVMGTPFAYTLFVNNVGPTMMGAVITDVVPANAYYISGGSQSGGIVTWSGLNIGSAAQVSFVVSTCQSLVTNASYGVSSSAPPVREQGAQVQTPIAAPSIVVSFTYSTGALLGSPVYLTGTTSTDGGPIVAWSWNLGDGTTASGPVVSHSYAGAGPFNVTLTVTDACGNQKSVSRSVAAGGAPTGLSELRVGPVGTQTSGVAFTLVITAYDGAGNVLTNYSSQATLADSTGTIQPTTFSSWINGVARPQVTIHVAQPFNGDVITVTSSSVSGSSNPFNVLESQRRYVYLPIVLNNYTRGKNLVVNAIVASAPLNPSVVIQNTGNGDITESFYVSLYLDPTSAVQINKFWYNVGCTYGMAWKVNSLPAGASLTLTPATAEKTPSYLYRWPTTFSAGSHSLWAQVDAWAASGTSGLVQETNEGDNIRGPVTFTWP